jgi:hypothetical protein
LACETKHGNGRDGDLSHRFSTIKHTIKQQLIPHLNPKTLSSTRLCRASVEGSQSVSRSSEWNGRAITRRTGDFSLYAATFRFA